MEYNDAIEMLRNLTKLLTEGLITQEEYDKGRAQLMIYIIPAQNPNVPAVPEPVHVPEPEIIDAEVIDHEHQDSDGEPTCENIDPAYSNSYSEESFWSKITSVLTRAGVKLIYLALLLYYAMPRCPIYIQAAIIAALGYFISPIDLVPDILPFVGFSDDLATITAAVALTGTFIDDEVKREARETIDNLFGEGTSQGLD
ncbi:MAG: DUF1232 domain-containing protein [Synergistaceae bacterium]|nr:DUF1232 domain-containing protein [Synergistaceae bacterium]